MKTDRMNLFSAIALASLAACNAASNNAGGDPQPDAGNGAAYSVTLASDPILGSHLADGAGRTLYYFAQDLPAGASTPATSGCDATCLTKWPAFHATNATVDPALKATDFGELHHADGSIQTTYKGWPLYYFAKDAAPGDVKGEDTGHVWFVLRDPFYAVMAMASTDASKPAHYLADPSGRTLYYFAKDTVGSSAADPVSACTGGCVSTWPPFAASGTATPTGLDGLSTFTRPDGATQSAWRGHPLYMFSTDASPGDTKGDKVGGTWFAVDPGLATPAAVTVGTSPTLGVHLLDDAGRSLYTFGKDLPASGSVAAISHCAGACATTWPPFHATGATVGDGLDAADFGEITRDDGSKQSTYRGWPLYRYGADVNAGDTSGDGLSKLWFVARAPFNALTVMSNTAGGPTLYLGDGGGKTLYYFTKDTTGTASKSPVSACVDGCLASWPIATISGTTPSAIGTQIKSFTRADGSTQASWKGHPLYYFAADAAPGDTKGQGVGGNWFVLDPTAF
jgi:predicted lipoprotein with Yx(FWY)xxD motif